MKRSDLSASPTTGSASPRRRLGLALLVSASAVLAFLALRSSPWLSELPWIPADFARWADRHGVVRNTVAFFGFGLLWFAALGCSRRQVAIVAGFSIAHETAQLWLPLRLFDWRDIGASLAGIGLALLVVGGFRAMRPRRSAPC